MPSCDNEKRKCKLIIAASTGLDEDSKMGRKQTGNFTFDGEPEVLFCICFCSENSHRLAENLAEGGEGKGQCSEMTER